MPTSVESGPAFVYCIPIPSIARRIALSVATFFLLLFCLLPLKLGFARSINSMVDDPLLWLILIAMFGSVIALMVVLAFPPKSWRARIEIRRENIRYFPRPPMRWMGEPTAEVRIEKDAREILICQGSQDHYDGVFQPRAREYPWGYRIVVRSDGGRVQELKISTGDRLNLRQSKLLSDGIAAATELPIHLVKRELSDTGTMREVAWTPIPRSMNLGSITKFAVVATPFIGGTVLGIVHPRGLMVVAIGVCFWVFQTLAVCLYAAVSKQWSKFATSM